MRVVLPIFLLFYSPASPRPQLSQVSGNSLEDEDSLAATPFLLASGLAYRDMLTISAARLVAQFGLNHNRTQPRTFKPIFSLEEASPGPAPQFAVSAALSLEAAPVYQTDREIFDFTDSRFIKPFPENQAHYPLLMPQDLDLITQAGSSALLKYEDDTDVYGSPKAPKIKYAPTPASERRPSVRIQNRISVDTFDFKPTTFVNLGK